MIPLTKLLSNNLQIVLFRAKLKFPWQNNQQNNHQIVFLEKSNTDK